MEKLGGVDLALVGLSADILNVPTEQEALEHVRTYKPDVFMPTHHDGALQDHMPLWRATEPVVQALRDADPGLVTVSRGYASRSVSIPKSTSRTAASDKVFGRDVCGPWFETALRASSP